MFHVRFESAEINLCKIFFSKGSQKPQELLYSVDNNRDERTGLTNVRSSLVSHEIAYKQKTSFNHSFWIVVLDKAAPGSNSDDMFQSNPQEFV